MKQYNKLVRDHIPEIITSDGHSAEIHQATPEDYSAKLLDKLQEQEEIDEFRKSGETTELVDVLEVLYAIAASRQISRTDLEQLRQAKASQRGGFDRRIILDRID